MKIAIIGAGLAGSYLAAQLAATHAVTVFEKARGAGGRMSTRRAVPYAFDHGAQYFTAASDEFRAFLAPLIREGTVATWPDSIALWAGATISDKPKFSAVPGMNALCQSLVAGSDVRFGARVDSLRRRADGWVLSSADGAQAGPYDWVISTAPAPQSAALLPDEFAGKAQLSSVEMLGCFALMLGFEHAPQLDWIALKSGQPPIGWMAVNSDKPGRGEACSLVVQSNNEWADAHLEDDPDAVIHTLLSAASEIAGTDLSRANHQALHRWRYASTRTPAGAPFLIDDRLKLAACADWCLGGKVEAAFLSANALAQSLRS